MRKIETLNAYTLDTFPPSSIPLLTIQRNRWMIEKPLQGLRILQNVPMTLSTITKIANLISAGAEVTAANFTGIMAQANAIAALNDAGIPYIADHQAIVGEFDIALDCGAQVLDLPHVRITKGIVELTQSGGERYKKSDLSIPVIDVDASKLKCLESMYGTGEGCVRAIKQLLTNDIQHQSVIVFGFGKVGKGIARYLAKAGANITIVDRDAQQLEVAEARGYRRILLSETFALKTATKSAFCIITATGCRDLLSSTLTCNDIGQAWLANMGAEDEIGDAFPTQQILADKRPVNFILEQPTLIEFLDPIFTGHNLAAEIIVKDKDVRVGYQPLPLKYDEEILSRWKEIHPDVDVSDI